jgi:hypothetical protein
MPAVRTVLVLGEYSVYDGFQGCCRGAEIIAGFYQMECRPLAQKTLYSHMLTLYYG